jgi:outer membrane cobalamin receptor
MYIGRRHDVRFFPDPPYQSAERLPAYSLVGVSGTMRVGRLVGASVAELTARLDNLLDEEYEAVAGFRTPGRTASIGARVRFGR